MNRCDAKKIALAEARRLNTQADIRRLGRMLGFEPDMHSPSLQLIMLKYLSAAFTVGFMSVMLQWVNMKPMPFPELVAHTHWWIVILAQVAVAGWAFKTRKTI